MDSDQLLLCHSQVATLKLADDDNSSEDRVKLILEKLDIIYKKDQLQETFQDLLNFEFCWRHPVTCIQEFLI